MNLLARGTEISAEGVADHTAVAAFDTCNLELVQAVVAAAEQRPADDHAHRHRLLPLRRTLMGPDLLARTRAVRIGLEIT